MTDTVDTATRSRIMASIRSTETGPEVALRKALRVLGVRGYRKNAGLPVPRRTADLVFRKAKVAVFVDGCFWHGCPEHLPDLSVLPAYWQVKIRSNVERDLDTRSRLRLLGWDVVGLWEHTVKKSADLCAEFVLGAIQSLKY